MKVLVACEESQEVCKAFRARGHEAYSCDIQECSGGHPEWHVQGDALRLLQPDLAVFMTQDGSTHTHTQWDLLIAHPPCTDLAVSGARWFPEKQKDGRQQKSIVFFMQMALAWVPRVCIENPIGIMSSAWRKPDQIIQPYEYGHPESKKTCLWLNGLPKLKPTNVLDLPESGHWNNQTEDGQNRIIVDGKWIAWNDPMTAKLRSRTYSGIAKAMSEQWG